MTVIVTSTGPLIAALKAREVMEVSSTGLPNIWWSSIYGSYSSSASDEEEVVQNGPENTVIYSIHFTMDTAFFSPDKCSAHLCRGPRGRENSDVPHIPGGSSPLIFSSCILPKFLVAGGGD